MDKQIKQFLIIGKIEGYSFLILLFVAMPMKYVFDLPMAVRIVGMLHGLLFLLFIYYILLLLSNKIFGIKQACLAFLLSLLPFGTFYLNRFVLRK